MSTVVISEIVYNCSVSVYTNISGLVTVRPSDFKINSYNPTFARLLFGFGDKELIDKVGTLTTTRLLGHFA